MVRPFFFLILKFQDRPPLPDTIDMITSQNIQNPDLKHFLNLEFDQLHCVLLFWRCIMNTKRNKCQSYIYDIEVTFRWIRPI